MEMLSITVRMFFLNRTNPNSLEEVANRAYRAVNKHQEKLSSASHKCSPKSIQLKNTLADHFLQIDPLNPGKPVMDCVPLFFIIDFSPLCSILFFTELHAWTFFTKSNKGRQS